MESLSSLRHLTCTDDSVVDHWATAASNSGSLGLLLFQTLIWQVSHVALPVTTSFVCSEPEDGFAPDSDTGQYPFSSLVRL